VLDATVEVETADGERTRWTEVTDFDASGPESRHYVRAATAGTIQFGDGRRGAVPPTGARVVTPEYAVGGGRAGNVGSAATWQVERVPADSGSADVASLRGTTVSPLGPATGGVDAESTTDALRRARLARETPVRCVTAADFEAVAASTPGLRVGRTAAWVADAETPDPTTHVVVVPYTVDDPRPEPSPGFLAAVGRHVDTHRLVGERVRVDPPTYVEVRVTATVQAATGYDAPRVEAAVADALDAFLDPLTGFDGEGWPFGRAVHQSELYDTVADVAGVARVDDVTARASGIEATGGGATVPLPPAALVAPGAHAVTVRTDGRWSA
jgi:predicted phage baseplate assembly protein